MNKLEYLRTMENALQNDLPQQEVDEIMRDYAEYFAEGASQGKTDDEIAANLGDPVEVAQQVVAESHGLQQQTAAGVGGKKNTGKLLTVGICLLVAAGLLFGLGSLANSPKTEEPVAESASDSPAPELIAEAEPVPSAAAEPAPSTGVQSAPSASAEDAQQAPPQDQQITAADQVRNSNDALIDAARSYAQTGDADVFWKAVDPMLDDLSALYGQQMADLNGQNMQKEIREYMSLQMEESLKEVEEERLEKAYRDGKLTRSEFEKQEKELERQQEQLENKLDRMETTEEMLERLERGNGTYTLFVEGFDEERIVTK